MKLTYISQSFDKIPAIKAIRGLMNLGLKEAKEFVEDAIENGEADYDTNVYVHSVAHINSLKGAGFILVTSEVELIESLNAALDIATRLRRYDAIRSIVDTIEILKV